MRQFILTTPDHGDGLELPPGWHVAALPESRDEAIRRLLMDDEKPASWSLINGRRVCTVRLDYGDESVVLNDVSEHFAHCMQRAAIVTPELRALIIGDRMVAA